MRNPVLYVRWLVVIAAIALAVWFVYRVLIDR